MRKKKIPRLEWLENIPGAIKEEKRIPWPILKKRLDDAFSDLIRMTHADDNGMVTCIDGCGRTGHWKEFDCGHFAKRDNLTTRWHLDNCRPQHPYCNRRLDGRQYEFGRALNQESPGLADRMMALADKPGDHVRLDAEKMLLEFREMLKIQRKRFR